MIEVYNVTFKTMFWINIALDRKRVIKNAWDPGARR